MFKSIAGILALASLSAAHGDHDQIPMAGPHKDFWYNTLPGDGGTQVSRWVTVNIHHRDLETNRHDTLLLGWFSILRNIHLRSLALFPLPVHRCREVRYCFPRCSLRYWNLIPTRCTIRAQWYQTRISSPQPLVCQPIQHIGLGKADIKKKRCWLYLAEVIMCHFRLIHSPETWRSSTAEIFQSPRE